MYLDSTQDSLPWEVNCHHKIKKHKTLRDHTTTKNSIYEGSKSSSNFRWWTHIYFYAAVIRLLRVLAPLLFPLCIHTHFHLLGIALQMDLFKYLLFEHKLLPVLSYLLQTSLYKLLLSFFKTVKSRNSWQSTSMFCACNILSIWAPEKPDQNGCSQHAFLSPQFPALGSRH